MIDFVSGQRFQLNRGKTAKMKNTDFTITNGNVMKTIYGDPFDEFYSVFLTLNFQSEKEVVELTLSSTGGWQDKPSCEWKGFRVEIFSADAYHDSAVNLEVTADAYEKQESVNPDFQEALQGAKEGDPEIMFHLSEIFRKGEAGVDKDDSKSLVWCRKSAEAGSARAMCSLGDRLIEGRGVQKVEGEGYWWYKKAADADPGVVLQIAEEDNPVAMYYLGDRLMGEDQIEQAVNWFKKAGERGIVRAMKRLGEIFREGQGLVNQDMAQSVSWYERAVEGGDSYAMVILAELYLKGEEIEKDVHRAIEWFERATKVGGSEAREVMERLGHLYAYGQDLPKDIKEAVSWFQKAAEADSDWAKVVSENLGPADRGDPEAMYNLGQKYHERRNGYELALDWYKRSAEKGHAGAMHKIGVMHYKGEGVEIDVGKSFWWFNKAAVKGDKDAMHALGDLYGTGQGVERDVEKAVAFFKKAAQGATEDALERAEFFSHVESIIRKWYDFTRVGVRKGPESALLKAKYLVNAEEGDADASYVMGCLYRFQKNYPIARVWYRRAADQGHMEAMCTIGNDYYNGYGESQDYEKALKWLRRAANLGYRKAVERLDDIHKRADEDFEIGRSLEAKGDYNRAFSYYQDAAELGHPRALESLEKIKEETF